jgi:hypothetical protein
LRVEKVFVTHIAEASVIYDGLVDDGRVEGC